MKTFNIALLGSPQKYIWQQLSQIRIGTRQSSVRNVLVPSAERDLLQQVKHGSHVFFHSRMGEMKKEKRNMTQTYWNTGLSAKKKNRYRKGSGFPVKERSINSCLTNEGRPGVHLSWAERPRMWKEISLGGMPGNWLSLTSPAHPFTSRLGSSDVVFLLFFFFLWMGRKGGTPRLFG